MSDNALLLTWQADAAQDTAGPSQPGGAERTGSLSPPMSPFAVSGVQAAADRTAAADDGRFSSLQRLSGSASTSQQVCHVLHTARAYIKMCNAVTC